MKKVLQQMPIDLVNAMNEIAQFHILKINEAAKRISPDDVMVLKLDGMAGDVVKIPKERIHVEVLFQKKEVVREWASPTAQGLMLMDVLLETSEAAPEGEKRVFVLIVTEDEHTLPVIVQVVAPPPKPPVKEAPRIDYDGEIKINTPDKRKGNVPS
jgi:hypothetical protein